MQENAGLLNIDVRDNGEIFGKGFPVKKIGGQKLKITENIYDITPGIQKVLTDTSNIPMKKVNGKDREIFTNFLGSLNFENY